MGGKKGLGEGSKKAQGQARKADAAAGKKAAEDAKKAAVEEAEWDKGAKKANAKKESEAAKKADAARKKAERDALLAEEEKSLPSRSAPKNSKTAPKKTRGLDLSQLDDDDGDGGSSRPLAALNASGIDNALDALGLTDDKAKVAIDRHPERRVKSAFEAFRERREAELADAGLSHGALQQRIRKDWDRSPENPKRQALTAKYNASKEEMAALRAQANEEVEKRLAAK